MARFVLAVGLLLAATATHAAPLKLEYFGQPYTGRFLGTPISGPSLWSGGFVFDLNQFDGTLANKSISFTTNFDTGGAGLRDLGVLEWTFSIGWDSDRTLVRFSFDAESHVTDWNIVSAGCPGTCYSNLSNISGDSIDSIAVQASAPPGRWEATIVPLPLSGVALFSALGVLMIAARRVTHWPQGRASLARCKSGE